MKKFNEGDWTGSCSLNDISSLIQPACWTEEQVQLPSLACVLLPTLVPRRALRALRTSVSVDSSLCVLSRVVQQSDRQWDMSLSFSLTGASLTWTRFSAVQSSSDQFSRSLSTARVSLCSSCKVQQGVTTSEQNAKQPQRRVRNHRRENSAELQPTAFQRVETVTSLTASETHFH